MKDSNGGVGVVLLLGGLVLLRYLGVLLLLPVVAWVWWVAGTAGLLRLALVVLSVWKLARYYRHRGRR